MNDDQKENYISNKINMEFVKKMNDQKYKYIFDDRYEFNKVFKNFINRDYFLIKENNYNEFIEFLIGKSKIVAKPINKNSNIKIEAIRINAKTDRKKLYNNLLKKNLLLIENFINKNSAGLTFC